MLHRLWPIAIVLPALATPGVVRPLTKEELKLIDKVIDLDIFWHSEVQCFDFFKFENSIIIRTPKQGRLNTDLLPNDAYLYFRMKRSISHAAPEPMDSSEVDVYKTWLFFRSEAYKHMFGLSIKRNEKPPKSP
jgi:hypothetical protein